MAPPQRPRTRHEFRIALICALRKESDAVLALFDGHWRDHGGEFSKADGDKNIYWTGWVGAHNVVLVQMPGMGNTKAAAVAGSILASFRRIRLSLVVGICGGVPGRTKQEMILGDVIIGTRIIQLTLASCYPDTLVMKETHTDQLGQPNGEVMAFLEQIQGKESFRRLQSETAKWTQVLWERDIESYRYPGKEDDKLYEVGYRHKHQDPTICDVCACCDKYEDPVCDMARKAACAQLRCNESKLVVRQRLQRLITSKDENMVPNSKSRKTGTASTVLDPIPDPIIHFGRVGSGDWVIKSQMHRNSVNTEVIAYEMEGSGVSHILPTLVIKSVCDYADSHKNKDWQLYAAATAAACLKAVLRAWPKVDYSMTGGIEEVHEREEELQTAAQREWYLKSLRFDQITSRFDNIKNAHDLTQRSFFWIKGKPGAGKSTAMKFLLADVRAQTQDSSDDATIVYPFFFSARGDDLEKSTVGLYRALLSQLLHQIPSLQRVLDPLPPLDQKLGKPDFHAWTIERLQHLFEHAAREVRYSSSLICVIDALDECEEAQVREMVTFFENLSGDSGNGDAAPTYFRTCFSSRHYPYITIDNSIELVLEDQDDHRHDIASYLRTSLKGHGKNVDEMKATILKRSSGIFLWVYLVVKILNIEYDHGRIHAMKKRLDEVPDGLDDLFYDILTRDTKRMDHLILTLRLILFARRPLKPRELYHAILVGTEPESVTEWDYQSIDEGVIQRFILSSSKGLAQVTRDGTVQFIHESVRDYFLKEQGLRRLWPDLVGNFEGLSHDMLGQCCQDYVEICISQRPSWAWEKQIQIVSHQEVLTAAKTFPFLEYAVMNGIVHADAAAGSGIEQIRLVERFSSRNWVSFLHVFRGEASRYYHNVPSSLYIFAQENLGNLLQVECKKDQNMCMPGDFYDEPLAAALRRRNEKAARALLTPAGGLQQPYPSEERHEAVIRYLLSEGNIAKDVSSVAYSGEVDVLAVLLRTKKMRVDVRDCKGRTPLWWAAFVENVVIVQLLLDTGQVDVNIADEEGYTPMILAASSGCEVVVRLLLESGKVELGKTDVGGRTALTLAMERDRHAVVQLIQDWMQKESLSSVKV